MANHFLEWLLNRFREDYALSHNPFCHDVVCRDELRIVGKQVVDGTTRTAVTSSNTGQDQSEEGCPRYLIV